MSAERRRFADFLHQWHREAEVAHKAIKDSTTADLYKDTITQGRDASKKAVTLLDKLNDRLRSETRRNANAIEDALEKVDQLKRGGKTLHRLALEFDLFLRGLNDQQKRFYNTDKGKTARQWSSESREIVKKFAPVDDTFEGLLDSVEDLIKDLHRGGPATMQVRRFEVKVNIDELYDPNQPEQGVS